MRNNQAMSQHKLELPSCTPLMSTTDPQSHITYANCPFEKEFQAGKLAFIETYVSHDTTKARLASSKQQ